jgi:hypothetical protein
MKPLLYKKDKKIICYIKQNSNGFIVCTGKPSDATCVSWQYDNLKDAEFTANEYFNNRTNFFKN